MSNQIYENLFPKNRKFVNQRLDDLESSIFPAGSGHEGKIACYDPITGDLTDSEIGVDLTRSDLIMPANRTIFSDNYNSVGGDMTIDSVSSIIIGHENFTVAIVDTMVTSDVRATKFDRNLTNDPIYIGDTYATAVNIGRTGQNVNVIGQLNVDAIDSPNPVSLFNNSPFITMGGTGGLVSFNGGIGFAGQFSSINAYYDMLDFNVTGSGAIPSQVVAKISLQRIGNFVYGTLRWTNITITATATSQFDLTPIFPIEYIPMSTYFFDCYVRRNGVNNVLGFFRLEGGTGNMRIQPADSPIFTIGDQIDFNTITFNYNINL